MLCSPVSNITGRGQLKEYRESQLTNLEDAEVVQNKARDLIALPFFYRPFDLHSSPLYFYLLINNLFSPSRVLKSKHMDPLTN